MLRIASGNHNEVRRVNRNKDSMENGHYVFLYTDLIQFVPRN